MSTPADILSPLTRDVQASRPATEVSLSRAGVTGVEKVIHVDAGQGAQLFFAQLDCFVDLAPDRAGVHMSRFEEIVNETIDEVVLGESFRAEVLAAHIAQRVRERQDGLRAEVRIAARYPETVPAPVSGRATQEIYTLIGTAAASAAGVRTLTGVQAQGMTACPCAQEMVATAARARLADAGFDEDQIETALDAVPVATHNQRGIGTLHIGLPEGSDLDIDAREVLAIVEGSMSSEIYELMKRPDELSVVEKAHANPRFVEDCVREMVRRTLERWPELAASSDGPGNAAGTGFLWAHQENLETIHRHSVVAERYGLASELAGELAEGEHSERHTTPREWLTATR